MEGISQASIIALLLSIMLGLNGYRYGILIVAPLVTKNILLSLFLIPVSNAKICNKFYNIIHNSENLISLKLQTLCKLAANI